ncbi:MAG: hypothetical protein ABIK07_07110 [Planctomycetota bacterium]
MGELIYKKQAMTMSTRRQRIHDHRLKDLVRSADNIDVAIQCGVPRFKARDWLTKPTKRCRRFWSWMRDNGPTQ